VGLRYSVLAYGDDPTCVSGETGVMATVLLISPYVGRSADASDNVGGGRGRPPPCAGV
jgi:hypothetical protein